ncbi:hypothetical protein [Desulfotomaculum nigrificans]|uniref:hypothetical protein n=1 Tax=Desulfotomaculum nigrificans TaxID=1565 RepID=UPI0002E109D4|nr:hypothetical protein [Desulfotomaculum nigrificans]
MYKLYVINNIYRFVISYDWHKTWLDNTVKNNQLTEEQAKAWAQHFDQMKEFHSKNGFGPMGGMMNNLMQLITLPI